MAKEYSNRRSRQSRGSASRQILVIMLTFLVGYIVASFFDVQTITQWLNNQVLAHHEMKKEPSKPQAQAAIPPKPKFEFYTLLANEKGQASQPGTNAAAGAHPAAVVNASVTSAAPTATTVAAVPSSATPPAVKTTSANAAAALPPPPSGTAIKPNSKGQQPSVATRVANTKPVTAAVGKGNYLVQVASFKARQDAEQMKGTLILKGFSAYIVPVSHASKGNWFRVVVGPYSNRGLAQQAQISLARNERLNGMITNG